MSIGYFICLAIVALLTGTRSINKPPKGFKSAFWGALIMAAYSAYAAREERKRQKKLEEERALERERQDMYNQPALEFEKEMNPLRLDYMKNIYMPMQRDYSEYFGELTQARRENLPYEQGYYQDLMSSRRRVIPRMEELITSDIEGIDDNLSNKMFERSRRRIALPFEKEKQRIGEFAASRGAMGSGAFAAQLQEVGIKHAQAESEAAVEQAIYESEVSRKERAARVMEGQNFLSSGYVPGSAFPGSAPGMPIMQPSYAPMYAALPFSDYQSNYALGGQVAGYLGNEVDNWWTSKQNRKNESASGVVIEGDRDTNTIQ